MHIQEEAGSRGGREGCGLCAGAAVRVTLLGEGLLWSSPRAPQALGRGPFRPGLEGRGKYGKLVGRQLGDSGWRSRGSILTILNLTLLWMGDSENGEDSLFPPGLPGKRIQREPQIPRGRKRRSQGDCMEDRAGKGREPEPHLDAHLSLVGVGGTKKQPSCGSRNWGDKIGKKWRVLVSFPIMTIIYAPYKNSNRTKLDVIVPCNLNLSSLREARLIP